MQGQAWIRMPGALAGPKDCCGKLLCTSWLAAASVGLVAEALVLRTTEQKHQGMTSCM